MPAQGSTSLSGAGLWTATPASRNTSRETPKEDTSSTLLFSLPYPIPPSTQLHPPPSTPLPTMVRQSSPAKSTRPPPRINLAPPFHALLTPPLGIAVFPPCLVANRRVLGRRLRCRHQPPSLPRLGPRRRPHRHPSPRGRRPEGEARQRPAQQHARRGRRRLQQHHAAPVHGRVARPQGRPGGCAGAVAGVYL